MNQESYRRLISNPDAGLGVKLFRVLLYAAAFVYLCVIQIRNFLYSHGILKTTRIAEALVISIGNLTAGGTGKTPLVVWVARMLGARDVTRAILTRGYMAQKGRFCDEPAILARSCPGTRIVINPDRVAGARKAVAEFKAGALIMDDGFQHRRLGRDIDIVTIDALMPFGYEKLLPAGMLREPVSNLKRADAVVITRSDKVEEDDLEYIEKRLRAANREMIIARAVHRPIAAHAMGKVTISLEELKRKKAYAFCGIGNPEAFVSTVKNLTAELAGSKIYNDHYAYTPDDITDIYEEARYLGADIVLSTQKDWTKMALLAADKDITFAYLAVDLQFVTCEKEITQLIEKKLADKIS